MGDNFTLAFFLLFSLPPLSSHISSSWPRASDSGKVKSVSFLEKKKKRMNCFLLWSFLFCSRTELNSEKSEFRSFHFLIIIFVFKFPVLLFFAPRCFRGVFADCSHCDSSSHTVFSRFLLRSITCKVIALCRYHPVSRSFCRFFLIHRDPE